MMATNVRITRIVEETPSTKTFFLDTSLEYIPGQYVMVWIHGVDEIPMSLSYPNAITVQKVGDATSAMFELRTGDLIGVRGPLGNGFVLKGKSILLIGGGVGTAPLAPLAEKAKNKNISVKTLIGAKTDGELLFVERFKKSGEVSIATDDGSKGYKGTVIEVMSKLDLEEFEGIYSCGPEGMMSQVLDIAKNTGMTRRVQFSLHRYIKCGIGICGSCCIDPTGLRTCRDGPVFNGEQLMDSEFGKYMRDGSGRRIPF